MHETILHKRSLNQRLASPTCMLFHFLNLAFTICMHHHSIILTLSIAMHSLSHSCSITRRRVWDTSLWTLPHQDNIAQSWEGRLCLPLQKCAFLAKSYSPSLLCANVRDSDYWPRKFRNVVIELATISRWDYALCNSNSQQLDWTVHCVVPVASQPLSSPDCALHSLGG